MPEKIEWEMFIINDKEEPIIVNIKKSGFSDLFLVVVESPIELSCDYLTKEQIKEQWSSIEV